jgi:hypothetical protein
VRRFVNHFPLVEAKCRNTLPPPRKHVDINVQLLRIDWMTSPNMR